MPRGLVMVCRDEDETHQFPSTAFLLRHSKSKEFFLLDLGIPTNWKSKFTPRVHHIMDISPFRVFIPEDVPAALARGSLSPKDIKHVCITHIHFDHTGDPSDFPNATFYVGEDAKALLEDGYPSNPQSAFESALFPTDRTRFLSPHTSGTWQPLGPFQHALDFYGDGSLYIVDSPGHMLGHLFVVARSSPDGGWIIIAGDVAHDWKILTGEAEIGEHSRLGCMHKDRQKAEEMIGRLREAMKQPRVRTVLSHDKPWYEKDKGGKEFWPGKMASP